MRHKDLGTLFLKSEDPSRVMPKCFLNDSGVPRWSGRHQGELSTEDLQELMRFCEEEGWRQGWIDARYARRDDHNCPFDEALLRGVPRSMWIDGYDRGANEYRETV